MLTRTDAEKKAFFDTIAFVIDEKAWTIEEIMEEQGIHRSMAQELVRKKLEEGVMEEVRKHGKNRLQKAYRLKRQA